jgi:nitrite reductase (cytochrome c-552)
MSRQSWIYVGIFVVAALLTALVVGLLLNIRGHKEEALQYPLKVVEIAPGEIDPAVWGQNFPAEYDTFVKTKIDGVRTPYGGSEKYSKLERYPVLKTLWAGYSFSKDYNEERGHYYALIDQKETGRMHIPDKPQPGACANCHAAEAPALIAELGWAEFNKTPYLDLADKLHTGSSCADCHDPDTMALRVTRPAFRNAMTERGIDVDQATRQEMRTYVCAQCHVEYYFDGADKILTFPWSKGTNIDAIDAYYTEDGFKDWDHKLTGAPMIKIQHPEYEMWTTSLHAASGVSCADCHMPYVRQGSVKVSDHWLRSPLTNVASSCQTCHNFPEDVLTARINTIQDRTAGLLRLTEAALVDAIGAISTTRAAGATDAQLAPARDLHRRAQLRWDFVASENSTGFHSPQEAARVLGESIDLARQAQLAAIQITTGGAEPPAPSVPPIATPTAQPTTRP